LSFEVVAAALSALWLLNIYVETDEQKNKTTNKQQTP